METEEYVESDDGYIAVEDNQRNILVDGRK